MNILPFRKSDEDFINDVRRFQRWRWSIMIPLLLLFLVIGGLAVYAGQVIETQAIEMLKIGVVGNDDSEKELYEKNLLAANMIGFRTGFWVGKGLTVSILGIIFCLGILANRQKDMMLLRYYDVKQKADKPLNE